MIGRGIASSPSSSPAGWVEHDPLSSSGFPSRPWARRWRRRERPVGLGITNQRETVVLWDRRTLRPVAPAIVWQDRRTSDPLP